jgi:hypothetical protein
MQFQDLLTLLFDAHQIYQMGCDWYMSYATLSFVVGHLYAVYRMIIWPRESDQPMQSPLNDFGLLMLARLCIIVSVAVLYYSTSSEEKKLLSTLYYSYLKMDLSVTLREVRSTWKDRREAGRRALAINTEMEQEMAAVVALYQGSDDVGGVFASKLSQTVAVYKSLAQEVNSTHFMSYGVPLEKDMRFSMAKVNGRWTELRQLIAELRAMSATR